MACISCGVITRAWVWRNSSLCDNAIYGFPGGNWSDSCLFLLIAGLYRQRYAIPHCGIAQILSGRIGLELEFLAQIEPAHVGIVDDVLGPALHQHFTGINNIGAVGDIQALVRHLTNRGIGALITD